jgi:hypothetical protein
MTITKKRIGAVLREKFGENLVVDDGHNPSCSRWERGRER